MARTGKEARHAAKRASIQDAAFRCFRASGLRGISISEICAEAGISPGHLYHYFDSKDDIVAELARSRPQASRDVLEEAMMLETPAADILLGELFSQTGGEGAASAALLFDVLADSTRNANMAAILHESHAAMAGALSDVIRWGQERGEIDASLDAAETASVLIALTDAMQSIRLRDPGTSPTMLISMINAFLQPGKHIGRGEPARIPLDAD